MTFSRIATVFATAAVLATPVVASAGTRSSIAGPMHSPASLRRSAAVKRKNNGFFFVKPLAIAAGLGLTVAVVEITKSK